MNTDTTGNMGYLLKDKLKEKVESQDALEKIMQKFPGIRWNFQELSGGLQCAIQLQNLTPSGRLEERGTV